MGGVQGLDLCHHPAIWPWPKYPWRTRPVTELLWAEKCTKSVRSHSWNSNNPCLAKRKQPERMMTSTEWATPYSKSTVLRVWMQQRASIPKSPYRDVLKSLGRTSGPLDLTAPWGAELTQALGELHHRWHILLQKQLPKSALKWAEGKSSKTDGCLLWCFQLFNLFDPCLDLLRINELSFRGTFSMDQETVW